MTHTRILKTIAALAVTAGSLVFGANTADAIGSRQTTCNGANAWGYSSSEGASTSALKCMTVKVARKLRNPDGGYYYTSYRFDTDGEIQFPGGSTTGGKHVWNSMTGYT